MLLSVYTPTNNHQWLGEIYTSLAKQTHREWEWILVPNGDKRSAIEAAVARFAKSDPRVRVYPSNLSGSIGMLKQFACMRAQGDAFIELDHDDYLVPDALEELNKAFSNGAGFVYSDWCGFRGDGSFEVFTNDHGWHTYNWMYDGRACRAIRAFPPTARSLCEIFYAPNHVRAWSRKAYEQAGGYDPGLTVADDHDLVCRTYLSGAVFHHIQRPLYFYRIHDTNTVKLFNADIQVQQARNRDKYIHELVFEECRRNDWPIVNIGTPMAPSAVTMHNVSSNEFMNADPILEEYENNSIGVIKIYDTLQLVPQDLVRSVMERLFRLLRPGGWLLASVPSTDGRGAFQDIRHKSWWNDNSWGYWTTRESSVFYYPDQQAPEVPHYQAVRVWTTFPSAWHTQQRICYTYADLCALKGQQQPGPKYC